MRKIGANYIFTAVRSKPWIKNGYLVFDDNGTVLQISGDFEAENEPAGLEFYSGYMIPGLVNAHLHLELSYLRQKKDKFDGLHDFVAYMAQKDNADNDEKVKASKFYDGLMYDRGVVLAADIMNSDLTLEIKKESRIKYVNFAEVYGLNPDVAEGRIDSAITLQQKFNGNNLIAWLSPHSTYSLSTDLYGLLRQKLSNQPVTTIHFLEGRYEKLLFSGKPSEFKEVLKTFSEDLPYRNWGSAVDFAITLTDEIPTVFFVHNTFADKNDLAAIAKKIKNPYFVLCPSSNLNVESRLPDYKVFSGFENKLLVGTDSLATNDDLDIVKEINLLLQAGFNEETVLYAATLNGAKALAFEKDYGSFEKGKKPGAVILQKSDGKFVFEKTINFV